MCEKNIIEINTIDSEINKHMNKIENLNKKLIKLEGLNYDK